MTIEKLANKNPKCKNIIVVHYCFTDYGCPGRCEEIAFGSPTDIADVMELEVISYQVYNKSDLFIVV